MPTAGDVAVITTGTVLATSTLLSGLTINVSAAGANAGTLTLSSDSIGTDTVLTATNSNAYGTGGTPTLAVTGTTTNNGVINLTGSIVGLQFTNGTLVNRGTIAISDASAIIYAPAGSATPVLENDGVISVANPDSVYQSPTLGANITGTGTINVSAKAKLDLSMAVGANQTLGFTGGTNAASVVQVDQPGAFNAVVSGFVSGDTLTLTNIPYSTFTYTALTASSGTLNVFSGSTLEASVRFSGVYSASTFNANYSSLAQGGSTLSITTSVINSGTGATQSGTVLPIYRFFDRTYGTHLFTADAGEVSTIKATRPDLTEETNGFGSVPSTDVNAESVYRFFNLNDGTHFYTASQSEFAGLTTQGSPTYRSDLSYEPNSTLYEHATRQSNDVAVYRLFDTVKGTQFLTGDQGEYAGITTPGTATYRGNLTPEGIAFYAPTGTFS